MYPTVQPTITDLVRVSSTIQEAFANPAKMAWKGFRALSKDNQVFLIALASLLGLLYTIQYISSKR